MRRLAFSPIHSMHLRWLFLLGLLLGGATWAAEPGMAQIKIQPPRPLPTLAAGREAEQVIAALEKLKGKPLILNFWASWCEPCRQEMPALQALAERIPIPVILVAVNDRKTDSADFLWEKSITLPSLSDQQQSISQAWGARVLPTTLFLDARHLVRYKAVGPVDWESPATAAIIKRLSQSKPAP